MMMRDTHTLAIRTASALMMAFGAWLMLAPLVLSVSGGAFWAQEIVGLALVAFGAVQMFVKSTLPSWITAVAAIVLIATPFAITVSAAVFWNMLIVGVAALLLSGVDGYEVSLEQPHYGTP